MLEHVALGAPGLFVPDDGQPNAIAQAAKPGDKDSAAAAAVGSMSRLQARVLKAGAVTASFGEQRLQGSHRAMGAPAQRDGRRRCAGPAGRRIAAHRRSAVPRGQRQLHCELPPVGAHRRRRQAGLRERSPGAAGTGLRALARSRQRYRLPAASTGPALRAALLGARLHGSDGVEAELQRHPARALCHCGARARLRDGVARRDAGGRLAAALCPVDRLGRGSCADSARRLRRRRRLRPDLRHRVPRQGALHGAGRGANWVPPCRRSRTCSAPRAARAGRHPWAIRHRPWSSAKSHPGPVRRPWSRPPPRRPGSPGSSSCCLVRSMPTLERSRCGCPDPSPIPAATRGPERPAWNERCGAHRTARR